MNIKLTPHAEELLEAVRAQRHEPVERIMEHALEALARDEHIPVKETELNPLRHQAVTEMIDFVKHNRVHLGRGLSVKDLIHEGHRV